MNNLLKLILFMKKIFGLMLVVAAGILMSSCASILKGSTQKVAIISEPEGARIYVNGFDQGAVTPAVVKIPRKKSADIVLRKEGYENAYIHQKARFGLTSIWGGLLGVGIDFATGSAWKFPKSISYNMNEGESTPINKYIAKDPKGAVSRNNPGATEQEKTIVRWYFESEPKGARLFWRVISSVPDEVKNTNETYLGSTPYEETRSFNIVGLTYANSRDVTIEIKVKKPGYIDQVKRFNVRQAIDQQEISSFFDLIKEDEK